MKGPEGPTPDRVEGRLEIGGSSGETDRDDLRAVLVALKEAERALERPWRGARDQFIFQIGFARGRLERISVRMSERERLPSTPIGGRHAGI